MKPAGMAFAGRRGDRLTMAWRPYDEDSIAHCSTSTSYTKAGYGQIVAAMGEPGVGKSRLLACSKKSVRCSLIERAPPARLE